MLLRLDSSDLDLFKKAYYDKKVEDSENKTPTHDKNITTNEFNKLTKGNFVERLKQAKLATKHGIPHFVKKTYLDEKQININKKVT